MEDHEVFRLGASNTVSVPHSEKDYSKSPGIRHRHNHPTYNNRNKNVLLAPDDADRAAGMCPSNEPTENNKLRRTNSSKGLAYQESLEIPNGDTSSSPSKPTPPHKRIEILSFDISHYSRSQQYLICAGGVFMFTLVYGYLQELISVHLLDRKLGLFLASFQFIIYSMMSFIIRNIYHKKINNKQNFFKKIASSSVPMEWYIGLSLLRAFDLAM